LKENDTKFPVATRILCFFDSWYKQITIFLSEVAGITLHRAISRIKSEVAGITLHKGRYHYQIIFSIRFTQLLLLFELIFSHVMNCLNREAHVKRKTYAYWQLSLIYA
jgi:hypothetical protein